MLQFITPVYLITNIIGTNEIGDKTNNVSKRKVYAALLSVRQSEFYQAQAIGAKPEILLVIRKLEYKNEMCIEYKNEKFNVLRTYDKNDGLIELTLTRGVNNGT